MCVINLVQHDSEIPKIQNSYKKGVICSWGHTSSICDVFIAYLMRVRQIQKKDLFINYFNVRSRNAKTQEPSNNIFFIWLHSFERLDGCIATCLTRELPGVA